MTQTYILYQISLNDGMPYCPSCGVIVEMGDTFCHECGEELKEGEKSNQTSFAESTPKAEEMTITIRGDDTNRYYNPHRIAYLQDVRSSLTSLGAVAVLLPVSVIILIMIVAELNSEVLFLLGAAGSIAIYIAIDEGDSAVIGTVTETDTYSGRIKNISEEVENHVGEIISVSGRTKSRYNTVSYEYHFVPKNIVKIEETHRNNIAMVAVVAFFSIIMSIAMVIIGGGLLGFLAFVLGIGFAALLYNTWTAVEVYLQSDQVTTLIMTRSESKQLINMFSSGSSIDGNISSPNKTKQKTTKNSSDCTTQPTTQSSKKIVETKEKERMGETVLVCSGCAKTVEDSDSRCPGCGAILS